jgi:hypothetical protein
MSTLKQAAQQFVADYDCGGCGHFAAYAENFRKLLAQQEHPEPPPEAKTQAEKIAYCAGWWAAMAAKSDDAIKNYQKIK